MQNDNYLCLINFKKTFHLQGLFFINEHYVGGLKKLNLPQGFHFKKTTKKTSL